MMVAESIGSDLSRITSELDKIFISLPEKQRRITPEIVEEFIGISKDYNIFELRDAIARKDVLKANRIVKYFDKNPKSGNLHSLVPQLFSFFQNMMAAYYCPNRNREDELAAWLGLRGSWAAREYVSAMRLYNPTKVMYIIQKLRTIAAKSNGLDNKNTTEGELMQALVFFILHWHKKKKRKNEKKWKGSIYHNIRPSLCLKMGWWGIGFGSAASHRVFYFEAGGTLFSCVLVYFQFVTTCLVLCVINCVGSTWSLWCVCLLSSWHGMVVLT